MPGSGQLLVGSLTGGSWAWNFVSRRRAPTVQYFTRRGVREPGVLHAVQLRRRRLHDAGPVVLTSSSGPTGTWTNETPASSRCEGHSASRSRRRRPGTASWTPQVAGVTHTNVSLLPHVLYPQPERLLGRRRLTVRREGRLPGRRRPAGSHAGALAGGTASTTVPLGLLPLQLVVPGRPGDRCRHHPDLHRQCGDGPTPTNAGHRRRRHERISVPYGTYTYTVTVGGVSTAHTQVQPDRRHRARSTEQSTARPRRTTSRLPSRCRHDRSSWPERGPQRRGHDHGRAADHLRRAGGPARHGPRLDEPHRPMSRRT